jgi:alkylhydroperoxidase/carboxymuconolactone decarboxylase family protein YurZ
VKGGKTMKLDARTRELITIGTAVGANCHP